MHSVRGIERRFLGLIAGLLGLLACAGPSPVVRVGTADGQNPARLKAVIIAISGSVQSMGVIGSGTSAGGWVSMQEINSNGLITSDYGSRRPVGRLAEAAPSLEDGSISLLPDGRMRVTYTLRKGVTWHDGAPFTAEDLAFTYQLLSDRGIPSNRSDAVAHMQSVEAADSHRVVVHFRSAYYLGGTLSLRDFWPQPRHLLADAYSRYLASKDPDEIVALPYWSTQYVHLGPFRLATFDPAEGLTYEPNAAYFLGHPKLDQVRLRVFPDPNTLYTNLLAGTVDLLTDGTLTHELGFQLKDRWDATGEGTIYVRPGTTRFLAPQWRPAVQLEPAVLDPRVRAALYQAIDREAVTEFRMQPAWSLLASDDRYHEATKDGFRPFAYNLDRARTMLQEAGWVRGPDGSLRHTTDGRAFRAAIWTTGGAYTWELPVYASYWRGVGLEVEEVTIPGSLVRNLEYRAHYPSWEASSGGSYDVLFRRFEGPPATAENRWVGDRGGYDDPRGQQLVGRFRSSLSVREQLDTVRAIAEFVAADLPVLIYYFSSDHVGVRRGVIAFDDLAGAATGTSNYGSLSRNAHLWDIQ